MRRGDIRDVIDKLKLAMIVTSMNSTYSVQITNLPFDLGKNTLPF